MRQKHRSVTPARSRAVGGALDGGIVRVGRGVVGHEHVPEERKCQDFAAVATVSRVNFMKSTGVGLLIATVPKRLREGHHVDVTLVGPYFLEAHETAIDVAASNTAPSNRCEPAQWGKESGSPEVDVENLFCAALLLLLCGLGPLLSWYY